jgi:Protein of unknown function (DUF3014)
MTDHPADVELDKPVTEDPGDFTPPRGRPWWIVGAAAVLVLALGGGYLYMRRPSGQNAPASSPQVQRPKADLSAEPGEQITLPPLDESDPVVRQLIERLSSHPTVAAWLTTDGLLLNFAVVTTRIANGESPVQELRAVGPVSPFKPRTSREDLFVDPSSYRRYDRYAEAVAALDSRGTARLYGTVKPRVLDAYRRLGQATGDFDPVLERAIAELLKVPVVHGDVELAPTGIVYGFVDPRLEGLSAAQKHLLRMGPQNVEAIQGKLREIADYLAIPAARLPRPSAVPR